MALDPKTSLLLAALSSATAASADLAQLAYEDTPGPCRSVEEDTIPQLADALKMLIEFTIGSEEHRVKDAEGAAQLSLLHGALSGFLAGWA